MNGFRIYKCSDLIEVKIDNISFYISPLSYLQKSQLQELMIKAANGDMEAAMKAVVQSMKMSIKNIKGLTCFDEDNNEIEYKVELINNELSEDTVNDILNLPISNKVSTLCTSLMSGLSSKVCDPSGKPLEGVEIVGKVKQEKK